MLKQAMVGWFAMVLPLGLTASTASAQGATHKQEPAPASAPVATAPAAPSDSAMPAPEPAKKKGGGLFGKVKGVAKNKVVQAVAKTAACTMVPGGQFVAGAIDAAANKNAAAGAAGAATGSSCPGMGGMGMNPGVSGGQSAALASAQAAQAAAGAAGAGGNAQMMAAMQMQMMSAQMAQMQQLQQMPQAGGGAPGAMPAGLVGAMPGGAPGAGMMGEAMGRPIAVATEKNKTVIRNIDWVPGTSTVSSAGTDGFRQALAQAGAAALEAGGAYRLDLYMDKQWSEAVDKSLGPQRLSAVQAVLFSGAMAGRPDAVPQPGKIKKDGDPRLEIVKIK